jgi:hypothetical protein
MPKQKEGRNEIDVNGWDQRFVQTKLLEGAQLTLESDKSNLSSIKQLFSYYREIVGAGHGSLITFYLFYSQDRHRSKFIFFSSSAGFVI